MLSFRPYQPSDAAFCSSLVETNMASYFEAEGIVWDRHRYEKELLKDFVQIVLWNEKDIGFYHLGKKDTHVYIHLIQILPDMQNQGIGSRVMQQIETDALDMGLQEIKLSVLKINPARQLYMRLGYQIEKDRGSKLLMSKQIQDNPRNA